MTHIRFIFRAIHMMAMIIILWSTLLLGLLLLLPFPARASYRWRCLLTRIWARWTLKVFGVRYTVEGAVPKEPFLLVCNHLSYIDILVIYSVCPGYSIAKSEVSSWPLIGWITRTVNVLFVNRSNRRDLTRVNHLIEERLKQNMSIILYAEGTTSDGTGVKKFMPSLLDLPARMDLPVWHASLTYRGPADGPPAADLICWWGDTEFAPHIKTLLGNKGFEAHLNIAASPIHHPDRKELARQLRDAVAQDFVPVFPPTGDTPHD